ncbi:hypothetical protein [uncultured Bacteroides sp.]|uniref:hypothetical protein n=1 Tax=uncultured Bacteroides sp. TaxID=162156 RepID=UPI0025FA764F|nr:hypothetical protein [uncultured Bacteroides sp.]
MKTTCIKTFVIILLTLLTMACSEKNTLLPDDTATPSLTWQGHTINLGESNGWSITRFNNWVAITNDALRTQFHFSWSGAMEQGIKENPALKVSSNGSAPVSYAISSLQLDTSDGKTCKLSVTTSDGEVVTVVFSLL